MSDSTETSEKENAQTSKYAEFSAGDKVEVDGERGMVLELHTDDFSFGDQEFEASNDEVVYVVTTESAKTLAVTEDEIEESEWEAEEDADVEELKDAETKTNAYTLAFNPSDYDDFQRARVQAIMLETDEDMNANAILGTLEDRGPDVGIGFDSWPDSWEESPKPARLIALDAWTSMGATFRGCRNELKSNRLCAAFKDEIYRTTHWR